VTRWRRALVTGASSGIGEAFAEQLASRGVGLILVGRDVGALDEVAGRVRERGVEASTVVADLGRERDLEQVVGAIRDADPMIDLLVNNAGLGQYGSFLELPIDRADEVVRVNDIALVRLTHAAAVRMVEAGRGSVIQLSSMASASPAPYQAVYAASKAFVSSFGQAISDELKSAGVTCTTVLPGYTRTRYFERVNLEVDVPDRYWMTAGDVAAAALDAAEMGRPLVIPGAINRRRIATTAPFPSLLKGRVLRGLGQIRRSVRAAMSGR
jgi:short-subunit dehydrogenase